MSQRGTATATILVTDVVPTAGQRARMGEVASDRLLAVQQRQLAEVVAACGGQLVPAAGHGVVASFPSASTAVVAAVSVRQHVARERSDLRVRVGVASGDVAWEDGDCFGPPFVKAARLAAVAGDGEILVTGVVRALAGERAMATYEDRGAMRLSGLSEPVEVHAVRWSPSVAPDDRRFADALSSQRVLRSPTLASPVPPVPDGLSEREVEVLDLVASGLANREIGGRLFISQNTVANHVRSILQKTGCANRAEAAAYAVRHGLAPR